MRWTDEGTSSDIEDRRGDSSGGGGGMGFGGMHFGLGGTLLLLVLSVIFKTNLFQVFLSRLQCSIILLPYRRPAPR